MRCMFPRAAVMCGALLTLASFASAQTAEEIVAKNLEAKGGVQLLRDTSSVRISGTITSPAGKGTTVSMSKRPNLFRREVNIGGQKMTQGFDGKTLWMGMSGMAAQEMPAGPQTEALKRAGGDFDSAFIDWETKGHKLEYKGKVTEGAKEFHRLSLIQKDGPTMEYYIDPTTWLEAKMVMQDIATKGTMEQRLTDYRKVEGRMIPFVMTQVLNGNQVAQIRLDRIEFNVPLDDTLFKMPK